MNGLTITHCPCCDSPDRSAAFETWNELSYRQCLGCGCTYQDPCLVEEYEEDYWGVVEDPDGNRRDLSTERDFKIRNWYGNSINYVNHLEPGRILDIGAGLGFFLSAIDNTWEKHAVEISEYSSALISDNVQNVFLYKEIGDIPQDNYFDVVMFYHVIEHLHDPHDALKKIHRMLKPNGRLIIGTPNVASIASKVFGPNFRLYVPGHIFLLTPKSLTQILEVNNFSVSVKEYPYRNTDYCNWSNILRMFTPWRLSPPFYGNIMTYYASARK